ncbi:MAG: type IV pilus assembly protein PilM [Endomicrobiales bacterium]|nr:type IV pilus assembly protein PilM [Endomicrobiales bacterium]
MIAVDIGSKNIKICKVHKKDAKFHVVSAVMGRNPAVVENNPKNHALLAEKIKNIAKVGEVFDSSVGVSVGGGQVVTRNFTLPDLSGEELDGAVSIEAQQNVSLDLGQMYSDYQVLSRNESGKLDVLFVAVPQANVDNQLQPLRNAGLEPLCVDINNLALANSFLAFYEGAEKQSVVLVDIGHSVSTISVVDSGALRFARNVAFGGKSVTAEIAAHFNIKPEMAEEIKKQPRVWKDIGLNIKNILRKTSPEVLEAIYRSVEYCMSRKKIVNIDKILVTGGTSCLFGLDSFIFETLGIQTECWNPLNHVEIKGNARKKYGPFLAVALGLAMRDIKNV